MRIAYFRLAQITVSVIFLGTFGAAYAEGQHAPAAAAPVSHQHAAELRLDNGKKWQADEHTRTSIAAMGSTYAKADQTSLAGLQSLGATLKTQTQELIAGCTMKGEAHSQLHLFLTQYLPAVNALAAATDLPAAQRQSAQIKALLDQYNAHFD